RNRHGTGRRSQPTCLGAVPEFWTESSGGPEPQGGEAEPGEARERRRTTSATGGNVRRSDEVDRGEDKLDDGRKLGTAPNNDQQRQAQLHETAAKVLIQTYRQQPLVLERGSGCRVWDASGRSYLDLTGGIAACPLGHAHPRLVAAIAEQAQRLIHV